MSSTVSINGKTYQGDNITTKNGKVFVDGKEVSDNGPNAEIKVYVTGNVNKLDCNTCEITGSVLGDVDANTVKCGDVGGDVDANTVHCGNVGGSIDANVVNKK